MKAKILGFSLNTKNYYDPICQPAFRAPYGVDGVPLARAARSVVSVRLAVTSLLGEDAAADSADRRDASAVGNYITGFTF